MSLTKHEKIFFIVTIILLLIAYLIGLSIDVTRDAAKYAYISKEIAQQGNWFNIMVMGEPYYQKPQLLFWLSASSFKLFGVSNFTFKLPVFIYSLLGYYAIFRLGKSLYCTEIGILSSLIASFSVISILYNMDIHTDIVLMTNISLSLWMLHEYLIKKKLIHLVCSGIALGLSLLTKGPFGVIIPFFAVIGFLLSTNKIKEIVTWKWISILLVACIVASPAAISICINKGINGLWFFLWDNNFRRVIGHYKGTISDPIFYIHNLSYLFLPWSIILFAGIFFQFKDFLKRSFTPSDHFVFWGTWIFFLLISVSKNKLPNYLMSLIPLLSIIAAKSWNQIFRESHSKLIISHKVILFLLWGLIFSMPIFLFPGMNRFLWLILIGLFLFTFIKIKTDKTDIQLILQTLLTVASLSIILNLHVFRLLFNLQGAPVAAKIINQEASKNEMVYFFNPKDIEVRENQVYSSLQSTDHFSEILTELHFFRNYEFMFYSNKPIFYIEHLGELPELINKGNCWIYTDENGKNEALRLGTEVISTTPITHFNLKRVSRYFNPKTRGSSFETMYLLHIN
jgi:4-amino-4-deoxy-L-arabinose transferase-like glycosyltransferase